MNKVYRYKSFIPLNPTYPQPAGCTAYFPFLKSSGCLALYLFHL